MVVAFLCRSGPEGKATLIIARSKGDSMKDSHTDFNALVENLIAAMEAEDVSVSVQNRLLKRLAPMSKDIIE